ncbi:MAG TPA: hypothetical protein P5121_24840 [Caldilineaceae bacterium]|nr:hypothetical protein [Caldilineaceae bacterium]
MTHPLRIAAIVTTFFPNSHAGVLVTKFLRGFPTDEGLIAPRTQIASLYIDQIHRQDIGLQLAHDHNVPVYESIRAALTLGGDQLAVDAVLLIGEHGDYPLTSLGQEMVPRRYFFEQICGVIAEAGRPIPIFNDKFLAYRWEDARWMVETAQTLGIPLWAGSSIPVGWRRPVWEHPLGAPLTEALAIGFHMVERYGYHALEGLQCQVERRVAGETGVSAVQCLSGDAVWQAAAEGRWSRALADRALAAIEEGPGYLDPAQVEDPHVFLLAYNDGLQGAVLMLGDNGYVQKFAYAGCHGQHIDAIEYHSDRGPSHATFSYLGLNIEDFFLSGQPPTPLARTYLTTGILEAALISKANGGVRVETPHLAIAYRPPTTPVRRPVSERPTGACLDPWPLPEPGATNAAKSIPITRDGTIRGRRT